MNTYEILDDNDNVVNTIIASPEFVEEYYPGHYRRIPSNHPPVIVITKFEFLMRFTSTERKDTLTAARTNVDIEDFMQLLNSANDVDLTNPETIEGVNALVSFGILTPLRAQEILHT